MAQLEYRLYDEAQGFPALFNYGSIPKQEIAARFACDYFTKEGTVYEKTSCAIEDGLFVVYVQASKEQQPMSSERRSFSASGLIVLEIRQFTAGSTYFPLIDKMEFSRLEDLLLYLQCNYLTLNATEWEKTSAEVDEDRKKYILYVQRSQGE
ncbi:MAG: hypothetical protein M1609_11285 [Firmicutes bacterium]|nr:hypothetical protein [Bacillota bacterium]